MSVHTQLVTEQMDKWSNHATAYYYRLYNSLDVVLMVRNVYDWNTRDFPDSSLKVPVNCGHNVSELLSVLSSHLHRFLFVWMVTMQILDPWRYLESHDSVAPISQFQPLCSYSRDTTLSILSRVWV